MSVAREKGAGQIMALLRTTRPLSSLVAGTMSASVVIAAQGRLSLGGFAAGLAMTALTMFGFVVNDVVDFNKDAGAGVHRPIARGELSRSRAMLFAAALLLSVYLVSPAGGWGDRILAVTSVALVVYSPLAQRFPSVTSGVPRSWISYATLACFVLGREALMDSDEQVGDRRAGLKTIATILGCRQTRRIGAIAMLLPAVFLAGVVRGSLGRIMALAALVSLTSVFLWPGLSDGRRIHLSRFPMLIGAVAIACGAK
jgi:4-hydroxybenzoate polyprenyltransferase